MTKVETISAEKKNKGLQVLKRVSKYLLSEGGKMSDQKNNKVIDITQRLKKNSPTDTTEHSSASIHDMSQIRQDQLESERREVKRTILTEFIAAWVVIPRHGLQRVVLHDISENGLSFDVPDKAGQFYIGEVVGIRIYLNSKTYFPFEVKITNHRNFIEEGITRHGASLNKGLNQEALYHFIKFIEFVSAGLKKDSGDIMVSNLGGLPPGAS